MKFNLAIGSKNGVHLFSGVPGDWLSIGCALEGEDISVVRCQPDPDCPHLLLAGTYGNGLFLSDDGGENWSHQEFPFPHLREIAFAPNDCDTIYVGTEPAELFRSRDSGRTWESLGLRSLPHSESWTLPYSPRAGALRTMFQSRTGRELIYAGIEQGGIAKSVDGGASWEIMGGGVHKDVHWIDSYWFDPDLIFAATGGGLFRSSDGGASWQRLLDGYTRAVHLRPRQADVLLAGPAADVGEGGELLLSRDGGDSWEGIGKGLGTIPMADMIECFLIAKELPDTAFALRSNGQLYEADYGCWHWQQIAAEVKNIQTVSLVPRWEC